MFKMITIINYALTKAETIAFYWPSNDRLLLTVQNPFGNEYDKITFFIALEICLRYMKVLWSPCSVTKHPEQRTNVKDFKKTFMVFKMVIKRKLIYTRNENNSI